MTRWDSSRVSFSGVAVNKSSTSECIPSSAKKGNEVSAVCTDVSVKSWDDVLPTGQLIC